MESIPKPLKIAIEIILSFIVSTQLLEIFQDIFFLMKIIKRHINQNFPI